MSSIIRRQQRELARQSPDYEPKELPFRVHPGARGYDALHPTKGWRRFSAARLRAIARLAEFGDRVGRRV